MTSRERLSIAMRGGTPDRVPVMCQLALGHYFLHSRHGAVDIWHDSDAFADALVALQASYRFDGILVNLPGRDPNWRRHIAAIRDETGERSILWSNGWITRVPADDNPHVYLPDGVSRVRFSLFDIDPERLYYVEPHDLSGVTYPLKWGFEPDPVPIRESAFFPSWHWRTIELVRARCADISVHGEVFSPFSQLVELAGVTDVLLALRTDEGRVMACLDALCRGTEDLMNGHARAGVDAVLISSAYAGGGFISPVDYRRFVLPFEQRIIRTFTAAHPDIPVYTHTCGRLADRLELLEETGTRGIDTLDPPPIGNVDLADAKRRVGSRMFLKGNLDPVNTVWRGTPEQCFAEARQRIEAGAVGGGYILSTACSVPPHAPPENIRALVRAAEEYGHY